MRAYVSASVKDMDRANKAMRLLEDLGVDTLHNWTEWEVDAGDDFEEFRRQRTALSHAHFQVLLHHPRNKASWMEYGFAIGRNIPVIGIRHEDESANRSLWFCYERYVQLEDLDGLRLFVRDGDWAIL
jgi:hypothetical protein